MAIKKLVEFVSKYPIRKYDRGELILVEGEVPSCAFFVKRGVVKGYSITADGNEKPIAFDSAGEIFPIGWIFNKIRWSPYYYDAFVDTELFCIPRDEYIAFLKKNPDVQFEVFDYFINRYLYFQMRVTALEQSKAIDKIVHTLHFLALRFGEEIAPNTVHITLPLSQQELANIIGLTRETTSIELNKLTKKGIIAHDRHKKYIIYTDRLNEALDIDYGAGRLPPIS